MTIIRIARLSIVSLLALLAAGCGYCPLTGRAEASVTGNSFVVRDVRVFDGQRVVEHANVVVSNGRIAAVGNAAPPADLPVIDGSDRTLVAGSVERRHHVPGGHDLFGPSTDHLRLADRGRVAPGGRADLVLVEGNPLGDPAAACEVARVFENGFAVRGGRHAR